MSDRNRMIGSSDGTGPGEGAGPPRTIVGGRPPEKDRVLRGLPTGIQKLLVAASLQETFKQTLLADPPSAARDAGCELSATEAAILAAIPREQLRVIRRLKSEHAMDVVATCMAAHAVPPELVTFTPA